MLMGGEIVWSPPSQPLVAKTMKHQRTDAELYS